MAERLKGFDNYTEAITAWREQYGSFVEREMLWRKIAVATLIIAGIAVAGLVVMSTQNKIIPYIVEVDANARPVSVTQASVISPTQVQIKATIARFIENFRTITQDRELQHKAVADVYAHLTANTPAANRIDRHFRANDPFQRAVQETVRVTIQSVLSISDSSWRVKWIELIQDALATAAPVSKTFGATLVTKQGQVTEKMIYSNPLGLFVTDIDWQEEASIQ